MTAILTGNLLYIFLLGLIGVLIVPAVIPYFQSFAIRGAQVLPAAQPDAEAIFQATAGHVDESEITALGFATTGPIALTCGSTALSLRCGVTATKPPTWPSTRWVTISPGRGRSTW